MSSHLTDVACLEWVRHQRIALAPETTAGVEIHLAGCTDCREKVAAFETLERSFHAYGAPMPAPRALRLGRALKLVGIGALVGGLIAAVIIAVS